MRSSKYTRELREAVELLGMAYLSLERAAQELSRPDQFTRQTGVVGIMATIEAIGDELERLAQGRTRGPGA